MHHSFLPILLRVLLVVSLCGLMILLALLGCPSGQAGDGPRHPADAPLVDFTQYWPHTPGTVYEYQTMNARLGGGGRTILTLGQPMLWCDIQVLPWIFTKSSLNAYWGPGAAYSLLWMITHGPSAYDGYYWSPGGWIMTLGDQDTPGTTLLHAYLYRTNNPAYPPYLLAPKQVRLPYQYDGDQSQN
jgi:hypothetical protein